MISFDCPICGKKYSVKDDFAGKGAKCACCGQGMRIPGVKVEAELSAPTVRMHTPPASTNPTPVQRRPTRDTRFVWVVVFVVTILAIGGWIVSRELRNRSSDFDHASRESEQVRNGIPASIPQSAARIPKFNPKDPNETRTWLDETRKECFKGDNSNALVWKEKEAALQKQVDGLVGRDVAWESELSNVGEEFAEVSRIFSDEGEDDRRRKKSILFLRLYTGNKPIAGGTGNMVFSVRGVGRELYLKLRQGTAVIITGEIFHVSYRAPLIGAGSEILQESSWDIDLVNCQIVLKGDGGRPYGHAMPASSPAPTATP